MDESQHTSDYKLGRMIGNIQCQAKEYGQKINEAASARNKDENLEYFGGLKEAVRCLTLMGKEVIFEYSRKGSYYRVSEISFPDWKSD